MIPGSNMKLRKINIKSDDAGTERGFLVINENTWPFLVYFTLGLEGSIMQVVLCLCHSCSGYPYCTWHRRGDTEVKSNLFSDLAVSRIIVCYQRADDQVFICGWAAGR